MREEISNYINSISHDPNGRPEWTFCGDGSGDFEERSNHASKEAVLGYIKHCQNQINLALKYADIYGHKFPISPEIANANINVIPDGFWDIVNDRLREGVTETGTTINTVEILNSITSISSGVAHRLAHKIHEELESVGWNAKINSTSLKISIYPPKEGK